MHSNKLLSYLTALAILIAPMSLAAGEGFFITAAVGSASLDEDFDGLNVDQDATAFRLTGGWQINRYFGLELGYQNFGDFEQTFTVDGQTANVNLSADGYLFGVVGELPVWRGLSLAAGAGLFFWDGEAEINHVSQADPGDTNLYLKLGLNYNFTEKFAVTSDWSRFDLDGAASNVLSLGIRYRFK